MESNGSEPLPSVQHLITHDERLRMVPIDPVALRQAVDALHVVLNEQEEHVSILRRIGTGLTALGRYDEAVTALERAVEIAVSHADPRSEVAARINLGDAWRYAGAMETARDQYAVALGLARTSVPDLLDFALQHQGKYLIDVGRPREAVVCLREALSLRAAKGDQALVESTVDALKLAGG